MCSGGGFENRIRCGAGDEERTRELYRFLLRITKNRYYSRGVPELFLKTRWRGVEMEQKSTKEPSKKQKITELGRN